jgi:hypothetical protein
MVCIFTTASKQIVFCKTVGARTASVTTSWCHQRFAEALSRLSVTHTKTTHDTRNVTVTFWNKEHSILEITPTNIDMFNTPKYNQCNYSNYLLFCVSFHSALCISKLYCILLWTLDCGLLQFLTHTTAVSHIIIWFTTILIPLKTESSIHSVPTYIIP